MTDKDNSDSHRIVNRIFSAREDDIQCDQVAVIFAQCADAGLSEEASKRQYPQMWHHFQFCPDCRAEYQMIMDLAELTAVATDMEKPITVPDLPDAEPNNVWSRAKQIIETVFSGFPQPTASALVRGHELDIEPVTVAVADDTILVELDVALHEPEPALRDLFCNIESALSETDVDFEGMSAWLLQGADNTVAQEADINSMGDVVFTRLAGGEPYHLILQLGNQQVQISQIVLP